MKNFILLLFLSTGILYGTVEVSGSVERIPIGGINVVGGSVTISFLDNDFPHASPETPVYLHFRYCENIRMAATLVDPESKDPLLSAPIFLPMLNGFDEGTEINAPADTLSIVDWRAGHREIWLKIQRSSESWLKKDGLPAAPSPERSVRFFLGTPARAMLAFEPFRKNLPFPTRNSELAPDLEVLTDAVNTTFCLDMSGIFSTDSFTTDFDFFAYGPEAKTENGEFQPSKPYLVDITGLFFNAQAGPDGCHFEVSTINPDILPVPTGNELWRHYAREINFNGGCDNPPRGRPSTLQPGSGLELSLLGTGFGFEENGIEFDQSLPAQVVLSDPFTMSERRLYRTARLEWLEASTIPERLIIKINVSENLQDKRSDLVARWHFDLMDPHEEPTCNKGLSPLGRGTLHLIKQPTEVAKTRLIPHLTRSNGGFLTQLIFSNATFNHEYVQLTSFDPLGQVLTSISVEVPPQQTLEYEAGALLGSGDHAWLSVPADGLIPVTAVYRANGPNSTPAAVPGTDQAATAFRIFPGDGINTWDGLALVNENESPVSIQIQQKNATGEVLATHNFGENGRGKLQYVLETDFTYVENTYFDIIATKPIYITALRGDRGSIFLWTIPTLEIKKQ